jgi:cytochrome c oxidase subunit 2
MEWMACDGHGGGHRRFRQGLDDGIVPVTDLVQFNSPARPPTRSTPLRFPAATPTLAIATAAIALSGCAGDLSTLQPAGPAAGAIARLWWIMLAGSAVLFLGVSAVLLVAWMAPAWLGRSPARRLVLWGGLVMPSVVLTALVTTAFALGEVLLMRSDDPPLRIEAAARMWSWDFRYPDGGMTENVLHIPAGRDVEFLVTSADVIHSFWVPRLGGKIDAVPGHVNRIRLRADSPGRYGGVCAEFCGEGHSAMRFSVEAHAADDYDAVLAREAQ